MIGLTNFVMKDRVPSPKLDEKRAAQVLHKVDEILRWDRENNNERDTRFIDLGKYLCEIRAGQYWRLKRLTSFDDFLAHRFPESRRKAYYLMSIHEQLPKGLKKELRAIGWSKAAELAKVARSKDKDFDCATWLHRARSLRKEDFKLEVERHLHGPEAEPWEIVHFKLYKSQVPVVEQALDVASLMLGSDRSRGYCLEMICADFLAGAHEHDQSPVALRNALCRLIRLLPNEQQQEIARCLSS